MAEERSMQERIENLEKEKERVRLGGGEKRIQKQHDRGKMTARERIEKFVDAGTFAEIGMFAKHRTTHFGMDKADAPADGVRTHIYQIRRVTWELHIAMV